jgi:type IV secretory pathway VirB2 component (pilin)
MAHLDLIKIPSPVRLAISSTSAKSALIMLCVLILAPLAAYAQGSPFDAGLNALRSLFTGTVAKVASLIAIVIGGYGLAHGSASVRYENGRSDRTRTAAERIGAIRSVQGTRASLHCR